VCRAEFIDDFRRGSRTTEIEALYLVAAVPAQELELLARLDAFGND
jgi:hypothetical protein